MRALDELTNQLIRTHKTLPARFLDWVGVEGTHAATLWVRRYMANPSFASLMKTPKAEIAVMHVVHTRVMPVIVKNLAAMGGHRSGTVTHLRGRGSVGSS